MSEIETRVYYSLHNVKFSTGYQVLPSPINSAAEKVQAMEEAQQTVVMTWGDLQITLFVCDDIPDPDIHQWLNWFKGAAIGLEPEFARSRYMEDGDGNPISQDDDW